MSDLGLNFDEEAPPKGRHRSRRAAASKQRNSSKQKKQRKRRRGGRTFLALLLAVLVLGGLVRAGFWGVEALGELVEDLGTAEDYEGDGTGAVVVEIRPDQSLAEMGQVLVDEDVVASQKAFVEAAESNPQGTTIQPGFYELPQQARAALVVELLLDLDNQLVEKVTIPEGRSSFNTFGLLAEELGIPEEEFEAAAEDPLALGVPEFWFNRGDDVEVDPSVEGFLFPSTYEFAPDPTAEQVLTAMVERFLSVVDELDFVDRVEQDRGILPYEALIVASLAQSEAGTEEDLGGVARVAYNRVYGDTDELGCFNCLQFDVTVNYWYELNDEPTKSSEEMTLEELTDPDNPYNRNREGLVPTPINNPGEPALAAAMDPPDEDWLYFVAIDDEGNSAFAATFDEHCANVQQAIEAGILSESC